MRRRLFGLTLAAWSAAPATALAAVPSEAPEGTTSIASAVSLGAGVAALAITAVLLAQMIALTRVAKGSAVADNIDYAAAGVACLAASVLAGWAARFLVGLPAVQARIGSDLLILMGMAFLSIYFYRVRSALLGFLSGLRLEDVTQESVPAPEAEGDGDGDA